MWDTAEEWRDLNLTLPDNGVGGVLRSAGRWSPRGAAPLRLIARISVAVGASGLACFVAYRSVPWTIQGKTSATVGYPLYADFNINKVLDGYYLAGFAFPLSAIVCYTLLNRWGPLRSNSLRPRVAPTGAVPRLFAEPSKIGGTYSTLARTAAVGFTLLLLASLAYPLPKSAPVLVLLGGTVGWVAAVRVAVILFRQFAPRFRDAHLNIVGVGAAIVLLEMAASRTTVTIASTHQRVHYNWFPLPVALVGIILLMALVAYWSRHRPLEEIERLLICYVAGPLALFSALTVLPGAFGQFSYLAEGENLAGGWLMLHGSLPWINIIQIHGALDDGLRAIIGFDIFGASRWGAHAGDSMFLVPAYWTATYLFAATVFRRRPAMIVACLVVIVGGISSSWDPRLTLLPLTLVSVAALVRMPSRPRAAMLAGIVALQFVVIPETLFAVPPILLTLFGCDVSEREDTRPRWSDFRRTRWFMLACMCFAAAFCGCLVAAGGFGGTLAYFGNFGIGHAQTSGIPPFPGGASTSSLGLRTLVSVYPPLFSAKLLELWIPAAAIFGTATAAAVAHYRRRRLTVEHWVALCAAGWTLIWFDEPASRPDANHLGYAFAASVPLLIVTAALLLNACEEQFGRFLRLARRAVSEATAWLRCLRQVLEPAHLGRVLAVALVFATPLSLPALAARERTALHVVVENPAPAAVVPGGPSLGYNAGAVSPGFATEVNAVLDRYAGRNGAVFDFSNAPGLFYFLLNRRPGSIVYDINEVESPTMQRHVISDLEQSRPRLVVWEGFGKSAKDEIPNEVRYYLISRFLLSHYRPLETVDKEHFLIADDDPAAPPLAATRALDLSEFSCAWGYAPNFLASPIRPGTLHPVGLRLLTRTGSRSLYELSVPKGFSGTYRGVTITRSAAGGPGSVGLSDVAEPNGTVPYTHEIKWIEAAGSTTTSVEVGSCLQWQGYANTLLLTYEGPGFITAVTLYRG